MKYQITVLLAAFCLLTNAQTKINFNYDQAGNQIVRELCLSGCSSTAKPSKESKDIEALTNEDLQKFFPEDLISYYPNPVKEQLYLKWEINDNFSIRLIHVFSVTGQLLMSYELTRTNDNLTIPFQRYPTGVYAVVIIDSNGDQKSIKIIKQ